VGVTPWGFKSPLRHQRINNRWRESFASNFVLTPTCHGAAQQETTKMSKKMAR